MCTFPENFQTLQYTQSKTTIPSLTFQISSNPAISTICSSFSKLAGQANSSKELSSNEKMVSTSYISRSGHRCSVRRRQTVLCLCHKPQCSLFRSRSHRCYRLQNQLSTEPSTRSLDPCPPCSQCRTPGRSSPVEWRFVPQDRSGDCHAVCRFTPRIPENVCQDVR